MKSDRGKSVERKAYHDPVVESGGQLRWWLFGLAIAAVFVLVGAAAWLWGE